MVNVHAEKYVIYDASQLLRTCSGLFISLAHCGKQKFGPVPAKTSKHAKPTAVRKSYCSQKSPIPVGDSIQQQEGQQCLSSQWSPACSCCIRCQLNLCNFRAALCCSQNLGELE